MTVNLVIDASVAVKWVVQEVDRDAARALLLSGRTLIAPAFLIIEAANVLSMKVSRREIQPDQATSGLETIRRSLVMLVPDEHLAAEVLRLAIRLRHPVYDFMYLACAAQRTADFVTADRKLLNKLPRTDEWRFARALAS